MWLVADSGSTKTEWILFDASGEREQFFTAGLNPVFLSKEEFSSEILTYIPSSRRLEVTKLWFYGAGCGSKEVKDKTQLWLTDIFENSLIAVDSDLLAAARAACGTNKGLVAILGTGSNSCYYDGEEIKTQIKPLGFILGDEGSGAALGKVLLQKLLRGELPSDLSKSIFEEIGLNHDEIIANVYQSKQPNRFLASCAKVLYNNKLDKEVAQIITSEFDAFANVLNKYEIKWPVHIIGSVGYYFEEEIRSSLLKHQLESGKIIKSPTKALVKYHLEMS